MDELEHQLFKLKSKKFFKKLVLYAYTSESFCETDSAL